MKMYPSVLPSKTGQEMPALYLMLESGIGDATIAGDPVFVSDPEGLVFTGVTTIDDSRTAAAFVGGGVDGVDYAVSALCTLSTGEVVEPVVVLPVVADRAQTQPTSGAGLSYTPIT